MDSVTLGQVALGSLRKDAEQPMENKAGGASVARLNSCPGFLWGRDRAFCSHLVLTVATESTAEHRASQFTHWVRRDYCHYRRQGPAQADRHGNQWGTCLGIRTPEHKANPNYRRGCPKYGLMGSKGGRVCARLVGWGATHIIFKEREEGVGRESFFSHGYQRVPPHVNKEDSFLLPHKISERKGKTV